MPWCPKCKVEYRKGFIKCGDCGTNLVEELEKETQKEEGKLQKTPDFVFLADTYSEIDAELKLGLLKSNGIKAIKKYPGTTGYMKIYMGTAIGIQIWVPKQHYKEAKDLLETVK